MGRRIVQPVRAITLGALCWVASLLAKAESAPDPSADTERGPAAARTAIVFGYTPDACPVSYAEIIQSNKTGRVLGFCGLLHDYLIRQGHSVEPRELPFDERFARFGQSLGGRPAIQCGPSSRTPARIAALGQADTLGFTGEFSPPFLVTSSKLLIRRAKVQILYDRPEELRIGLLKPRAGLEGVTTEVVEAVFANARFVGLSNRTEAIQRLTRAADAPDAIDAYASDEVILRDILTHDIPNPLRADYAVEPPLGGYSREEYVLVIFNAPDLTKQVTEWLESPAGRSATRALRPPTDPLLGALTWLVRSDRLSLARQALVATLALAGAAIAWVVWWRLWRPRDDKAKAIAMPAGAPLAMNAPAAPAIKVDASVASAPVERALTAREQQILALLAQGRSNKETARELGLSYRTVEAHRKNIYTKLGIKTTAGLVEYALAHRLG